jgi:sarcosine oxidase
MFNHYVKPYLKGITNKCVKAQVCLYSVTSSWEFLIDFMPGYDNRVVIASPCSGYGFKYATAIGEGLAEQALSGRSELFSSFAGVLNENQGS